MDEHLADLGETLVFVISNYSNECAEIHRGGFEAVCQRALCVEKGQGGRGLLKVLSLPLSDCLSTKHFCFRHSQDSGGSGSPFHLPTVCPGHTFLSRIRELFFSSIPQFHILLSYFSGSFFYLANFPT